MKLARLIVAAWLCGSIAGVTAQTEKPPAAEEEAEKAPAQSPAEGPADVPTGPPPEEQAPEGETIDEAAIDADIASQELSGEAKVRLDAARDSVVQIRGLFDTSETSAFHGSGFAVGDGRRIVTNYHVVAQAVLYPRQYRLEYLASDGRTGPLHVLAIDVRNDLAIVAADDLELPALQLRGQIPAQGERAWSIGFPLNLGLTITEGVANGLVENTFESRIHYTGAINGGMSGGPALDRRGRVYGVNVSVVTGRQLVGFVVPAKHIPALLLRAREPLDVSLSAQQLRQRVTAQVHAYENALLGARPETADTQSVRGYAAADADLAARRMHHGRRAEPAPARAHGDRQLLDTGPHPGAGGRQRGRAVHAAPDRPVGGTASAAIRAAGEPPRRGPEPRGRVGPRGAVRLPQRAGVAGRVRCAHLDLRAPVPAVRRSL